MTNVTHTGLDKPTFRTVSIPVFLILTIATLGLYHLYWFYRTWKIVGERQGQQIWPLARVLAGIVFLPRLFAAIDEAIVEAGCLPINARLLAAGYLVAAIGSRAVPYLWVLQILILVRVQAAINRMNRGITGLNIDAAEIAA
jgi:hypothetical protein